MNVLSLFDGMSCGQIALKKAGVKISRYFASEIDSYAIGVTNNNFPSTIQLGDVTKLEDLPEIDLLIGGSPCQSFSKAVSYNTGFNGKSRLFFEYVRILRLCKPKYFLLENVVMKQEFQDVITEYLGVPPVKINSDVFSVQSRERLHWTNIPIMKVNRLNTDVLQDILEEEVDDKYYYSEDHDFHGHDKVVCATINIKGHDILKRVNSPYHKLQTLTAVCGGNQQKKVLTDEGVRKLTPLEYERAMNIPDNYSKGMSDSQRYKMIGNAWEVNTLAHVFRGLL